MYIIIILREMYTFNPSSKKKACSQKNSWLCTYSLFKRGFYNCIFFQESIPEAFFVVSGSLIIHILVLRMHAFICSSFRPYIIFDRKPYTRYIMFYNKGIKVHERVT